MLDSYICSSVLQRLKMSVFAVITPRENIHASALPKLWLPLNLLIRTLNIFRQHPPPFPYNTCFSCNYKCGFKSNLSIYNIPPPVPLDARFSTNENWRRVTGLDQKLLTSKDWKCVVWISWFPWRIRIWSLNSVPTWDPTPAYSSQKDLFPVSASSYYSQIKAVLFRVKMRSLNDE